MSIVSIANINKQITFRWTSTTTISLLQKVNIFPEKNGDVLKLRRRKWNECKQQHLRCHIQAWMTFDKAVHFIKCFNPSLPYNIQATVLSQNPIIQIQHGNVNSVGPKRSTKNQQNPVAWSPLRIFTPTYSARKKIRPCIDLGNRVPERQPHGIPTHHTLVPREAIKGRVESNEDEASEGGKKRVGEARDRVGFMDHKGDACFWRKFKVSHRP